VPDGGLAQVMAQARVQEHVIKFICQDTPPTDQNPNGGCGCDTLEQFFLLSTAKHEAEDLRELLQSNAETKDRVIFLTRLRQAWRLANNIFSAQTEQAKESSAPTAAAKEEPPNPEDPLSSDDRRIMVENWQAHHGFGFLGELSPAQTLLNRLGREWSPRGDWRMTLLQVGKVGSVLHDNRPRPKTRLPLAGTGVCIELENTEEVHMDGVLDYYWRLVTMCNAWAFAGAFLAQSAERPGEQVIFMPYEDSCSYPQRALMHAMAKAPPGQRKLWLENKDLLTRGKMLMHVNRQTPAGEALKLALDETRVDWTTKELTPLPGFDSRYAVAGPDSRHDDLDSAPRAGASHATRRGSKSKGKGRNRSRSGGRGNIRPEIVNVSPGGKRACRDYNKGRCQKGSSCPFEHSCWYKYGSKLCRGTHPASKCKPR